MAEPKKSRSTARMVRNLRNCPVHLRVSSDESDKPYRIQLQPRGLHGDTHKVPAKLMQSHEIAEAVGYTVEVITETEARKIEYPPVGYLGGNPVKLVRNEEQVLSRTANQDEQIQAHPRSRVDYRPTAPIILDVPGSDPRMKALSGDVRPDADAAIPADVDLQSRRVSIERVKEKG